MCAPVLPRQCGFLLCGFQQSSAPGTQSRSKGLTCCREKQKRQEGYILGPIHKARPSRSEFPSQIPLRDLCVDVLSQGRARFWLVMILSKLTPQKKTWRPETLLESGGQACLNSRGTCASPKPDLDPFSTSSLLDLRLQGQQPKTERGWDVPEPAAGRVP